MLPSGLTELVGDDESLARFLPSKNHFNTRGVKHAAFLPSAAAHETSVFRHTGDPASELWAIGAEHLTVAGRAFHGAAIVKAREVRAASLDVGADEPPPRHAIIKGWPVDPDPELQKAQHKARAMSVAAQASLLLRSPEKPAAPAA
jgi:hypothetical protein